MITNCAFRRCMKYANLNIKKKLLLTHLKEYLSREAKTSFSRLFVEDLRYLIAVK